MVIQTDPQASIRTYVTDQHGQRRFALLTSKQFLFNKLRDFQWHTVGVFTAKINPNGLRGRVSELEAVGYEFDRRYDTKGRVTHLRLHTVPGVSPFLSEDSTETTAASSLMVTA